MYSMYYFIINPASRSGKGLKIWKTQVEPILQSRGVAYRSFFSEKTGDVMRLVREITESADSAKQLPVPVILLGGDGTVNEALQGIDDTSKVVLGYIPTGSSNDFARDLQIPRNPSAALNIVLNGSAVPMDLGTVTYPDGERRHFAVSCGMGFDAAVCEEALHSKLKNVMNKIGLGKLTYLGIALRQLFAAKAVSGRLTIEDGAPIDIGNILFIACMLHRFEGGGFMFAPDADPHDGILDICAAGDLPKLLVLFALPTAFKGKHYRFKGITPFKAGKLTLESSSPLWIHTDGEVSRKSSKITVSCQQNSILILCPDSSLKA